eukprot:66392_1
MLSNFDGVHVLTGPSRCDFKELLSVYAGIRRALNTETIILAKTEVETMTDINNSDEKQEVFVYGPGGGPVRTDPSFDSTVVHDPTSTDIDMIDEKNDITADMIDVEPFFVSAGCCETNDTAAVADLLKQRATKQEDNYTFPRWFPRKKLTGALKLWETNLDRQEPPVVYAPDYFTCADERADTTDITEA